MEKRWYRKPVDAGRIRTMAEQLHISQILAQILLNRGIDSPEAGRHFFSDTLDKNSGDPFLLKDMDRAVARICQAIDRQERIVIYGDYDVDGITSTSLLYRVLSDLGAVPDFYIPERQTEGYGLNAAALRRLAVQGTDLLITVDCGISSYDIVRQFAGTIDIIITDHNEPPPRIPPACAVLNPKQPDCPYPFKELAGVGEVYKVSQALYLQRTHTSLRGYSDLAALGTIADLVPLIGENRLIVRDGLQQMKKGCHTGIQALLDTSGLSADKITAGRIAFTVAPRLNAAGRISHARKGVQLLLSSDSDEARRLAEELSELNRERQDIEHDITCQAVAQIDRQGRQHDGVLLAYGREWHSGVIGIAASRLVETYYRPALVISVHDGMGKGSCRSIKGFNIYAALQSASDLLVQYGGHPMAAGFSLPASQIEALRERLNTYAHAHMTADDYVPGVAIDRELNEQDVTLSLIQELSVLEPYGMGNSRPVFSLSACTLDELRPIGRDKKHIRLRLHQQDGAELTGVGWSMAEMGERFLVGDTVCVAFQLEQNDFNGISSPQLVVQDIQGPAWPVQLDRPMMIDIYLALKKCIPEWGMPVWKARNRMLAAEGDRYNAHDMYAAITVLKELGILKVRQHADGPAYYFPQVTGKMELSASPTYRQYSKA